MALCLEIEVDERLDISRLNLSHHKDDNDNQESLTYDTALGDKCDILVIELAWQEMDKVAKDDEQHYARISWYEVKEDMSLKVGEYLLKHNPWILPRWATEENPAKCHEMECYDLGNEFLPSATLVATLAMP